MKIRIKEGMPNLLAKGRAREKSKCYEEILVFFPSIAPPISIVLEFD